MTMSTIQCNKTFRYTDGTGGCDGCLNWSGVGFRDWNTVDTFKYPNVNKTDNNGLEYLVEVLEHVYIDAEFPKDMAPPLTVSLKGSGKSRADLWAFAAMVAVEYGIQTNNMLCDGSYNNNPEKQCNQDVGNEACKVQMPRSFVFKSGRKDCTEFGEKPYQATKTERHPNPAGNGNMTMDFFKDDFDFNGREVVTIMGAHTFGRLHTAISLYKYTWTTRATSLFNNHYYK